MQERPPRTKSIMKRTALDEGIAQPSSCAGSLYGEERNRRGGQDCSQQRTQQINCIVADASLPLQRSAKNAVEKHTGGGGTQAVRQMLPRQQPHSGRYSRDYGSGSDAGH